MRRTVLSVIMICLLLGGYLQPAPVYAGNYWSVGSTVNLCAGTKIRQGNGNNYPVHTVVPHNNWPVRVIGGPRYTDGQTWWDVSRQPIDGGGTGWVSQSDADRCNSNPPPAPNPQPGPAPAPPSPQPGDPPFSCVGANVDLLTAGPVQFNIVRRVGYTQYQETLGAIQGGTYCRNIVKKDGIGYRLELKNWNLSFTDRGRLSGYGVESGGEIGTTVEGEFYRRRVWRSIKYSETARWPYTNNTTVLNVTSNYELRDVIEIDPPQPNWSYAYKQLQVVIIYTSIFVAGVYLWSARFALMLLGVISGTYGVPVEGVPAAVSVQEVAHSRSTTTAQGNVDPQLVELLKQGYGPIVDTATLRPMNAAYPSSSLAPDAGSRDATTGTTQLYFAADGFVPSADVLVVADRAGVLVAETSVFASSDGKIEGQLLVDNSEVTKPGIITIIAIEKQQIQNQLNQLASAQRSTLSMDIAADAVTVAPAPRLMGNVTFDPWPIVAGRPTTATYAVRNTGDIPITLKNLVLAVRGPDCPDWCNDKGADWPPVRDITLQPSETFTVSTSRNITLPGVYTATVAYQDINSDWRDADGSHRFPIHVQPGIVIQEPLTISPTYPIAGDVVTIQFRIKNDSSETLNLLRVMATGRGPDCINGWECTGFGDAPQVHAIQLAPDEEYTYSQRRIFTDAGLYFTQPLYQFTNDDWHLIGSRHDFQVAPGVRVERPLRLDPPQPVAGQPVHASYTLKNVGNRPVTIPYVGIMARGPDCAGSSWECSGWADWPWVADVQLLPGDEYQYESTRILHNPGTGYWAEPQLADQNPWWLLADGGQRLLFTTKPGLTVIEPLRLEPATPAVGEAVTARFTVRNDSGTTLPLKGILIGTRGPHCSEWDCTHSGDFPWDSDLLLSPGQEYTYEGVHTFTAEGEGYFAQLLSMPEEGYWNEIGEKQPFPVIPGLSLTSAPAISPTVPIAGEPVEVQYTLKNLSNRQLTLTWLGVSVTKPACEGINCETEEWLDFPSQNVVTLSPGAQHIYKEKRTYEYPGEYTLQPFFTVEESWAQVPGTKPLTLTVAPGIELLQPVTLTPANPQAGELVTAQFTIRNASNRTVALTQVAAGSRGPGCTDWACSGRDFNWEEKLSLEPGQVYTYENTQVFAQAGSGYFVQPYIKFGSDDWTPLGMREPFIVAPGMKLIETPTLSPLDPVAGEVITVRYKVRNSGSRPLSFSWLGVSGGGPDCTTFGCAGWADFPSKENVLLSPSEELTFSSQRFYMTPGRYIYQPAVDVGGHWTPFGTPKSYSIAPGLEVTEDLSLTPDVPLTGETVTARYKIHNAGTKTLQLPYLGVTTRGPDCTELNCGSSEDFPTHVQIQLGAGETHTYETQRVFYIPGSKYFAQAWYTNTLWSEIGTRTIFTVQPGLRVVDGPVITPLGPVAGELVTMTYTVKNVGGRPIYINKLAASGGGPNCTDFDCNGPAGYPTENSVTIPPGAVHLFSAQRIFLVPGEYFIQPTLADSNEWWHPLPESKRFTFTVSPGLNVAKAMSLSPSDPIAGEMVTVEGKLYNSSNKTIALRKLGVAIRGPECATWDNCTSGADFKWSANVSVAPGETITYSEQRVFPTAGEGYFARFVYESGDGVWTQLGSEQRFVVGDGLTLLTPLTLLPLNPDVGETVRAEYSIHNSGNRSLVLPSVGVVARGPNADSWADEVKWADFPIHENVVVQPGHTYTYVGERKFELSGTGYFADAAFADMNPWWYEVPGNERVNFIVGNSSSNVLFLPNIHRY